MAASRNDMYVLSTDAGFRQRVQAALLLACVSIANEGWAIAFHRERAGLAMQILLNTNSIAYNTIFANSVATDSSVISDATAAGTVTLTSGNIAVQAALVTDTHIDTAIASQFNAYLRVPS